MLKVFQDHFIHMFLIHLPLCHQNTVCLELLDAQSSLTKLAHTPFFSLTEGGIL